MTYRLQNTCIQRKLHECQNYNMSNVARVLIKLISVYYPIYNHWPTSKRTLGVATNNTIRSGLFGRPT